MKLANTTLALWLLLSLAASVSGAETGNREAQKARLLEESQRDVQKAAILATQDNTTLTIFFKSGATHQVRFDSSQSSLDELSGDFAASDGSALRKSYSFRSVNNTRGSLSVDLGAVEGISEVNH